MKRSFLVLLPAIVLACSTGSNETEDDAVAADSAISIAGVTSIDLTVSSGLPNMECRPIMTVDFGAKTLTGRDCEGHSKSRALSDERVARVKAAVAGVKPLSRRCDGTTGGDLATLLTVHSGSRVRKYISSHADGAGCYGQIAADNHSLDDVEHVVFHIFDETFEGKLVGNEGDAETPPLRTIVTASGHFVLDFEDRPWLVPSFVNGRNARVIGPLDEARTTLTPDSMLVCPASGTTLHCGPPVMDNGCQPEDRSWLAANCEGLTFTE
jgi:hypothetical protein